MKYVTVRFGHSSYCNSLFIDDFCFVLLWKFLLKELDWILGFGHLSLNLTILSCGSLVLMVLKVLGIGISEGNTDRENLCVVK